MKLKIWGARGSIPTPLTPSEVEGKIRKALDTFVLSPHLSDKNVTRFIEQLPFSQKSFFGGNTTSVEIFNDQHSLIIDGGSGLRLKGVDLLKGPCGKGQGEVHIYMTHFHWDHLMGIPFFIPIFIPGNIIHFYSVDPHLEEAIKLIFTKPYFPVPFSALSSKVHFHHLKPREKSTINGLHVTPYRLDHPDPCWGAKVELDGKVYAHVVDNESKRISQLQLAEDLPLYQGVDLMYYDAQYAFDDMMKKVDWGHASAFLGMDLAFREKVKKIIFTHHDPMASDTSLEKMIEAASDYYQMMIASKQFNHRFDWSFAVDGMEIEL